MPKGRGDEAQRARPHETAFRRKRRVLIADPNEAFVRAFADALSDILEEELRLSA